MKMRKVEVQRLLDHHDTPMMRDETSNKIKNKTPKSQTSHPPAPPRTMNEMPTTAVNPKPHTSKGGGS